MQELLLFNMKKIITLILLFSFINNIQSNTKLPWDSLFDIHGLSTSMKLIPLQISSNLNIKYCNSDRVGLWGLTTPVARHYGLIINNEIDERYDIKLASETAAYYLKDLSKYWNNEILAQLAYINGSALIIELATIYGINIHNATKEEIDLLYTQLHKNNEFDSITDINIHFLDSLYHHTGYVKYKFKHPIRKQTLQNAIFTNIEDFEIHNLSILKNTYWINNAYIPKDKKIDTLLTSIYEIEKEALELEKRNFEKQREQKEKERINAIKKANSEKIYYVKSGDTLSHIAQRHKVTVQQIKKWNNLKSDFLKIGQKLKIHIN